MRLRRYPQRVECFDISTIHGSHAVGSMVTFIDGEPDKNLYRHFRIRTIDATSGGDDFGMMLEVLKRRFSRGKAEADLPDLIVVDGGRGQLAMALTAMAELGIEGVDAVGLAKMRVQAAPRSAEIERTEERVFVPGQSNPVDLEAQLERALSAAASARRSAPFRDHAPSQASFETDALFRPGPYCRGRRSTQARSSARLRQRQADRGGLAGGVSQGAVDERTARQRNPAYFTRRSPVRTGMTHGGRRPNDDAGASFNPSAWLIVPTLSLLAGQAVATGPFSFPLEAGAVSLLPLLLVGSARRRRWVILLALSLLAFFVGYLRHRQLLVPEFPYHHLRSAMARDDGRLYLEGTVRHEPEKLVNRSRWQVTAERLWHPAGAEEITGDILVTLRTVRRDWRYGDRVRFWVRPLVPQDSGNPGGFDYATYLARRAIYATGFLDGDQEVELLARHRGALRVFIEDIRRDIRRFIERNLSRDSGALLAALVVGDMGGITKETRTAFTAAGVNHVLSISGLHVAMLGLVVFVFIRYGAQFSTFLMLRLNLFKVAAFCSFVAVVFYTALAGAMVPTVRSAIMIGVYQLAVLLDREEEVFASLTLAALLIGLVWPGVVADISFQLSFLAVLFIVWGMRKFYHRPPAGKRDELPQERRWLTARLRQASMHLAVPLLATLGTGPLIAHYFGHVSLAGFVANPLIVPLVGFIVVPLGLLIGFFAVLAPATGILFVGVAEWLLSVTAWLVQLLTRLPFANLAVPSPNALEIALLYGLLVSLFAFKKNVHRMAALALGVALLVADGSYWWHERYQRKGLRVTHLNVGQGDAAVVELPGSKVMLIDAGGAAIGDFDTGEAIVAPYLRSRKILKVDYLVVTHPRIDHYGGMRAIASEFSPQEFWSGAARGQTGRFDDLEEALEQARIPRVALDDRQPCRTIDQVRLCALYPAAAKSQEGSVVLRLEFGKLRYLFAGDVDKRDEMLLLQRADEVRSAVLKVPRHGGPTASTREFIAAVRPAIAVISAGARSRNEAQREEVAERYEQAGAEILRTSHDGAIVVETDGNTLRYSGYKSGKKGEIDLTAKTAETRLETAEIAKVDELAPPDRLYGCRQPFLELRRGRRHRRYGRPRPAQTADKKLHVLPAVFIGDADDSRRRRIRPLAARQ